MKLTILSIFVFKAFALDIADYAPGTFISVIIDARTNEIFYSLTKGARYKDGSLVDYDKTVIRGGGHGQIARANGYQIYTDDLWGGGILIENEAPHTIMFKSASVNSANMTDMYNPIMPDYLKRWFSQGIANEFNVEVLYKNEIIRPGGHMNLCTFLFSK